MPTHRGRTGPDPSPARSGRSLVDPAASYPLAVVGGRLATGLVDVTSDLAALDSTGFWAVVLPFEGDPILSLIHI